MRRLLAALTLAATACTTLPSQPEPPPTVPYVWATFDRERITAAGHEGMADRGRGHVLTIDNPVRIASVTKLVVALGVMRLVEQGTLDLDRDVSDYLGWPLRNPAFPDRPITLRMMLSHTSSITDSADYVVPLGTRLRDWTARPGVFDGDHAPGAYFRYSNLNFPLIASAMERAANERFDQLMARLVLRPLGLDACFNWTTCSDNAIARATVLYAPDGAVLRDDLQGQRPACPVFAPEGVACDLSTYRPGDNGGLFSPQGGLRISARGLAEIGRMLLNRGRHLGQPFLGEASVATLLTPQWRFNPGSGSGAGGSNGDTDDGFYCAYGQAVQAIPSRASGCNDDLFGDGRARAGHAGDAYGLRSGVWIDPERGTGIAFFATSLGDDPPRGRSAYRAIEEWLARHGSRRGSHQ